MSIDHNCPPSSERAHVLTQPPFDLAATIRAIPDFPRPGVLFRDITTLLSNALALQHAIHCLIAPFLEARIRKVAGVEARGFILGGALAQTLSAGFVPIRKAGKLPSETFKMAYSLEYGMDQVEMHVDAVDEGERVILTDDLIATGGTAEAAVKLLRKRGAEIVGACFIIDLPDLGGRRRLEAEGIFVHTLVNFSDIELSRIS